MLRRSGRIPVFEIGSSVLKFWIENANIDLYHIEFRLADGFGAG
jgi:hypothetical protein